MRKGDTVGARYIDGKYFRSTLEDVDRRPTQTMLPEEIRRIKAAHETANPPPAKRRVLPRLLDVPGLYADMVMHASSLPFQHGFIATHGLTSTKVQLRTIIKKHNSIYIF